MEIKDTLLKKPRIAFLLVLAIAFTLLFYWVIKDFILTLVIAAVIAGILHPLYLRFVNLFRGRKALASSVTVLLGLVLVIFPLLLFAITLVDQAIDVSVSSKDHVAGQMRPSERFHKQIEEHPDLKQLLPYEDKIMAKARQIAAQAGEYVARGLAAGVAGTATLVLFLFIILIAEGYFLVEGRQILDEIFRFTPLSADDTAHLLGTFASVGRATLKGTLVIGIVQGGLGALAFWVAGIGGVFFWGTVMAVASVIPSVGTALVWVPAVIYLFFTGQTVAAVGVALWCAIVVGSADNVLRPMLVGRDTQMPDLIVMLTTFGGLTLFGAAGLLVGPLIGAMFMTVWKLWGRAMDEDRNVVDAAAATNDKGK